MDEGLGRGAGEQRMTAMACTPVRSAEIGELAGGRLGAEEAAALIEHVEGCAACSTELDLVADLLHVPARAVAGAPARGFLRRVAGFAALAAAAAALVFWLRGGEPERRPRNLAQLTPPPLAELVLRGEGEPGDADFARALESVAAEDYARACEGLRELLGTRPDEPLLHFYLGVSLLQVGEFAAAVDSLRRAEEVGTGFLAEQALWYRAQAHLARDAPDDGVAARELLRRLVELDGDYEPNARAQLAGLEPLLGR